MPPAKDLLSTEQQTAPLTLALVIACALTGLIVYVVDQHLVWIQWTVLIHIATGIACSAALLPYFVLHFRRTIGYRRTSLLLSGLLTIPIFCIFLLTGWHLMFYGQQENQSWVLPLHIISSIVFLVAVILHLLFHRLFLPERRKLPTTILYASLPSKSIRFILLFNIAILALVGAVTLIYQAFDEPYKTSPAVEPYLYDYGTHPFRPSQTETHHNQFIDERQIGNSHRCLSCHQDIGKQWMSSIHQQAAADPTYVTNISLLAEKKGISATRYCEGCHAPVALLTGELSPGGEHGGIEGTPANLEGIPCMGCHGIESLPHLKGVASYRFKPAEDYLFAKFDNPLLSRVQDLLIRVRPDQHKKDVGRPLLRDPKICSTCHTQFMDKDMNNWGWLKMQDEYGSWLESPYSQQHEQDFSNAATVRCQDCHMPLVKAVDPSSNDSGEIRAHHFPGANTVLPLLRNDIRQLDETIGFLQSNKLRVSIEKPNRKDALQNLQALDEALRDFEEAPYYYYLGETAEISVIVSNTGVGHNFPGGTTDINEAWIEFLVLDAEGRSVYQSGLVDDDLFVDPSAHFYKSVPIDRNGKHVWRHDLFNMVGESFRRVIKAGESDIVRYKFSLPGWVKPPITLTATLKYRKLNQQYAQWALQDLYTEIPIVDVAWDTLSIPVRIRKEVD
jgi:Cytochrome c554 and c-prime